MGKPENKNKQGAAPEGSTEQAQTTGENASKQAQPVNNGQDTKALKAGEDNKELSSSETAKKQETQNTKAPEESKEQSKENETASTPKEVQEIKPNAKEKKRLEAIFKKDPMLEKVYKTTDGFFFQMKGLARNHAKTLEDKNIVVFTKSNN